MYASSAVASGFNLKEQSVSAMGNAFAGATAGAEDVSYSYFNAAGLTRQKGDKFSIGGTYIAPRSKARHASGTDALGNDLGSGGKTKNIVHAAVAPQMYYSHQFNDQWYGGFSLNIPFGMITKYEDDWVGRYHGTLSKVTTVTATPMVAYKANDKLSLGAGLPIQYTKARLRNATLLANPYATSPLDAYIPDNKATLEGDAIDVGYQLGAMYEFSPETRVGVNYRSEIRQKLAGDLNVYVPALDVTQTQDITAKLNPPGMLSVGIYHELNDKWSVMAEYQRVFWSSFDRLNIKSADGQDLSMTEENWRDTNFYSVGASYKLNDQWKLRAGIAYDQRAVGDRDRTPRIPDSDRIWYSTGVQYNQNEKLTWNVGYTYIRAEKASVDLGSHSAYDATRGSYKAEYANDVHMFGLSMTYNF